MLRPPAESSHTEEVVDPGSLSEETRAVSGVRTESASELCVDKVLRDSPQRPSTRAPGPNCQNRMKRTGSHWLSRLT